MTEFRLQKRQLKLLGIDNVPQRHRQALTQEIEFHVNQKITQRNKLLSKYEEHKKALEEGLKEAIDVVENKKAFDPTQIQGKTHDKILENLKGVARKDIHEQHLIKLATKIILAQLNLALLEEYVAGKGSMHSNAPLIKYALAEAMNNFHNRFPSHNMSKYYPQLSQKIQDEAKKMNLDLQAWLEKDREIFKDKNVKDEVQTRHRLKIWPLFIKCLKHVNEKRELSG